MKITGVKSLVVGAGMRNWVFVKVETDQPGLVGWGEATLEWRTRSVVGALEDLRPLLVGQDPFRIEHLWQSMARHQFWKGGIVSATAQSGVDQALHDIKAKSLHVPVYDLLGGAVRERVRCYDHLGGGAPEAVYGPLEADTFAAAAHASVESGFTAVKVLAVPPTAGLPSSVDLRAAESVLAAVRDAVGPEVDVMVDMHGRTTWSAALRYARVFEQYSPYFLEEPVQPEDFEGLARVASGTSIPIATGERLLGRAEFARAIDSGVAVVQPDVCHCGGLSEMRRIAALAEVRGVAVAPHNPLGPVSTAYNIHFAAATPNWLIQEQMRHAVPWFDDVVTAPMSFIDGHVEVPRGPGLGLEVDERAAAAHPYVPEKQIAALHSDGSVADW